ncbi:MAG: MarR family EPS-associated transcriptional regulator [Myxococcota bacterium]
MGARLYTPSLRLSRDAKGRSPPVNTATSEIDLTLLENLAERPSMSQRELARAAGVSVSRVHFVLRRLVEKGLVKVKSAASSEHKLGYLYLLTPRGLEAKARLSYAYLQHVARQYQRMCTRVDEVLAEVRAAHPGEAVVYVWLVGQGPLAEVVMARLALHEDFGTCDDVTKATAAVVTDPARAGEVPPGLRSWGLV